LFLPLLLFEQEQLEKREQTINFSSAENPTLCRDSRFSCLYDFDVGTRYNL
jgi:hypothetical protein